MLSVSVTPSAWCHIARIGGDRTEISRMGGELVFLDFHKMGKPLRNKIITDALNSDMAKHVQEWQAWGGDEEGNERFSIHETREQAEYETDEDCKAPTPISSIKVSSDVARAWCGQETLHTFQSLAALSFLAFKDTKLDGIWWHDTFDPWSLSAPRGGVFQDRIPSLQQKIIPGTHGMEDEDCFEEVRRGRASIDLPHTLFPIPLPGRSKSASRGEGFTIGGR